MNLNFLKNQVLGWAILAIASASTASAQTYRVTIKNLTANQNFVGIHTSFHRTPHFHFQTGSLLPDPIAELFYPSILLAAAERDPVPSRTADRAMTRINTSITPGNMMTFKFKATSKQKFFSFFSPLHATDDGFVGIDSARLPRKRNQSVTISANVYDAGLFENTEDCDLATVLTLLSPPPECAPHEVVDVTLNPNSPVIIHSGIHGIGDLSAAKYDWKNPVAEISIQKISKR